MSVCHHLGRYRTLRSVLEEEIRRGRDDDDSSDDIEDVGVRCINTRVGTEGSCVRSGTVVFDELPGEGCRDTVGDARRGSGTRTSEHANRPDASDRPGVIDGEVDTRTSSSGSPHDAIFKIVGTNRQRRRCHHGG